MKLVCVLVAVAVAVMADEKAVLKELTAGNLKFTANTYKELAKQNAGKNFLVCPLSVAVVLALTEAGAGGKTAQQLIAGLNLPDTEEKIHEAFKAIAPSLNVDDQYTLSSANKVYVKQGYKIRPQFKNVATQVFNAEVSEIEFTKPESADTINKWVLDKTHDKIKDLINKSDLDEDTRLILINALYFHGLWVDPFYVESTTEKTFHLSSTQQTKVKMMEQTNRFNYYEDATLKAKFLEMPYAGGQISMVFVLPDDIDGLSALEANIEKVLETPKFTNEKVHVQIPHVNVESKIDFIPILKQLGVVDAFDKGANFSRFIENDEDLVISKIIQKTFIAVEEKGTTAAAATAVVVDNYSAVFEQPSIPKEFDAKHPFIFVLKSSNGVLFVGRYVEPTK